MPLYLDHAASSPCLAEAADAWLEAAKRLTGNASARAHAHGAAAADAVELAREQVAGLVGADPADVVFTASTTEANHLALGLMVPATAGPLVFGEHDHASVVELVGRIDVIAHAVQSDAYGTLDLEQLATRVTDGAVVSLLHGNNEVGTLLELTRAIVAARRNGASLIHVDAAQSARYVAMDVAALDVDTVALSSHKLGGPPGVAALVCRPRFFAAVRPTTRGGGQERGVRAGTHNVPAIVGFGVACRIAAERMSRDAAHVNELSTRFWAGVSREIADVRRLGPTAAASRLPHIVALHVPGVPARLLQQEVRDLVSIATGSACASTKLTPSRTLLSMGMSPSAAMEVVRVSFGPEQTHAEASTAAQAIVDGIRRIREGG